MRLLILGASGLVGGCLLRQALAHAAVTAVIAPTRTALPTADKLVNPVGPQLERLLPTLMADRPDAVLCALGTTMAQAGSKAAFVHVDRDLPVAVAEAAHAAGVPTFGIVTAMGASASARSFYYRTKGAVELDLQRIGFRSLTICRPSLIGGARRETRAAESVALGVLRLLAPILPRKLRINPASAIAASLLEATLAAAPGCHWIYSEQMTGP